MGLRGISIFNTENQRFWRTLEDLWAMGGERSRIPELTGAVNTGQSV